MVVVVLRSRDSLNDGEYLKSITNVDVVDVAEVVELRNRRKQSIITQEIRMAESIYVVEVVTVVVVAVVSVLEKELE